MNESELREKLISKLLDLGYPKASIVIEVPLHLGRQKRYIDLAIKDPDTNQFLAIFEIKNMARDIQPAIDQIVGYSNFFKNDIQLFLYHFLEESEHIYAVNSKDKSAQKIIDLPAYQSLKNIELFKEKSMKFAKELKKRTAINWSNIIAGMTSSIAIAISITMLFGLIFDEQKSLNNDELTSKIKVLEYENKNLSTELNNLKSELDNLSNGLKSISTIPDDHGWKIEANTLTTDVQSLKAKLTALENAITEDPAKALAVPMLRKDLDNTEETLKAEISQTKSEIDRMYDQNKWFIGLMFTIALSVLGIAASGFFNRKDT